MKVLIADDNDKMLTHLRYALNKQDYEVIEASDGESALKILQSTESPSIAILDWNMPGFDGPEICKIIRQEEKTSSSHNPKYLILLTIRNNSDEIAKALMNGANDHMAKPFDFEVLQARVAVGVRVIELQQTLSKRVKELEEAVGQIKTLEGLIPICMHCHKIKDDQKEWHKLEAYIHDHSEATFSHGLCPECKKKHYPEAAASEVTQK